MSYHIEYREERGYIYVVFDGFLDIHVFQSMAREVGRLIQDTGCDRILSDMRKSTLDEGVGDVYFMPKQALAAGVSRSVRRALVVSAPVSDYCFLETVFVNQGNVVKVFEDFGEAEKWLFSEESG